jgi:hypothetical protein
MNLLILLNLIGVYFCMDMLFSGRLKLHEVFKLFYIGICLIMYSGLIGMKLL